MSPDDRHDFPKDGVSYPADAQRLQSYIVADQQLSQFRAPVFIHTDDPHERLYVACLDGTGNDETKPQFGPKTNVANIRDQINAASNKYIYAGYIPGPGTQDGWLARTRDGISGGTYDERIEEAYKQFIDKAKEWRRDDPRAEIRVAEVGFSRGADQEAGLARLIHERGIQDRSGAIYTRGPDGLIVHVEYTKPPLVAPGQVAQAELLFDPVGTGHPQKHDRRPPPSVISGFQIIAADERRSAFKSDHIIDPGMTPDGRFLGVTVAGAHSDVGGSYYRNGLGIRSENLGINYLNALSDTPFLATRAVPEDPRMNVVHCSERAFPYELMGRIDRSTTHGYNEILVPRHQMRTVSDPRSAEPGNEALSRQFEHRPVTIAPDAATHLREMPTAAATPAITRNSSTHDMFEALCAAAINKDSDAMRGVERSYLQSGSGQAWLAQGHGMNQHIQIQTQQAALHVQQAQQQQAAQQNQGFCR